MSMIAITHSGAVMSEGLSAREKQMLCGFYLSREDRDGLKLMGFKSFEEAYNVLGLSLNANPASIKNYRDEFDPLFPATPRKGWRNRPLRASRQKVYEKFKDHDANELFALIAGFTGHKADPAGQTPQAESASFAKRLLTGRAAENFFLRHYRQERQFADTTAENMTHAGCGYDFSLRRPNLQKRFAVEVKGLTAMSGGIVLTDKEYTVAEEWKSDYFLYIVKNFGETPYPTTIRNPANAGLQFKRAERKIIQISWSAKV